MNIQKIKKVPLREIWKKEDKDFSVWLEENIDYLNDIIDIDISVESREEKVGPFRVDLYGEDNFGNKVIIENQLEKTDHSHLGQIITYLVNLEANTAIWIAKEPTEEHIKTIDWLNEITPDDLSFYLIKLEAIRIGEDSPAAPLFTIIKSPSRLVKQIGAEKKEYAQRHIIRRDFWKQLIEAMNGKNSLCANLSPSTDNWLGIALGISGISVNLVVSKKYARSEVYINRGDKEENKKIFDFFYKNKDYIEKEFGDKLTWERMNDNVTSRIKYQNDNFDVTQQEQWEDMNIFLIESSTKMHKVFKSIVKKLRNQ